MDLGYGSLMLHIVAQNHFGWTFLCLLPDVVEIMHCHKWSDIFNVNQKKKNNYKNKSESVLELDLSPLVGPVSEPYSGPLIGIGS